MVATSGTESLLEDCVVEHLGTSAVVAGERGRISVRASRLRDARGNGVLANGQAHVLVEDCEISAADKPGVAVEEDSSVRVVRGTVRECVVGVFVNSTGRTVLEDVPVRDTTGHGFVVGAGSSPTLSGCRSERTAGHGLLVAERSRGTVRDCVFTAAEEPAVRVCGFSSPVLTGVVVRDAEGTGLLLDEDSAAELDRLEVLDAGGSGIVIRPGANPLVRRATVARCGGHGVEVSKDGRGRLEDCAVEEPSGSAVHVSGHGNLYVGGGRLRAAGAGSNGWYARSSGGWTGDGCNGSYDSVPMSGDTSTDMQNRVKWWWNPGTKARTCQISVYIPNSGNVLYVGGHPTTYHVLVNANDRTTKYDSFTINQVNHRGQWVNVGTFAMKGPTIGVKLLDRGDDWSKGWEKAHHAAAQMKATCRS
ncbi:right-handed parallel beta-helix repeat-containing protein [Streptomyces sp. NPDC001282]|uniref:right-handed parallel beta-helix repeat-containing protein n=1 Tax=Streptomyces sp. NPDC001282 TaxID=3364557 RepID=UPI0036B1E3E5